MNQCPEFQDILNRYILLQGLQVGQLAACNRLHEVDERLARWLLMSHDRANGNAFPITHDQLAQMLGSGRPSVTVAAGGLQRAGVIEYKRGQVKVVNREGLEQAACECYARHAPDTPVGNWFGTRNSQLIVVGRLRQQRFMPSACRHPPVAERSTPYPNVVNSCSLSTGETMSWASKLANPYRVVDGKKFRLKDFDPSDTKGLHSKEKAEKLLAKGVVTLAELQDKLYAQDRWAILLIFQAMDAAGKDGAIKHVMSGINPQGCQVYSFKAPSSEELDHDYLWRTMQRIPERGRIGIFNRSYYEEVLIVRVHPDIMAKERIPEELLSKDIWENRFEDICAFERYLSRNGVVVRKFFLNVSKKEQKKKIPGSPRPS